MLSNQLGLLNQSKQPSLRSIKNPNSYEFGFFISVFFKKKDDLFLCEIIKLIMEEVTRRLVIRNGVA